MIAGAPRIHWPRLPALGHGDPALHYDQLTPTVDSPGPRTFSPHHAMIDHSSVTNFPRKRFVSSATCNCTV